MDDSPKMTSGSDPQCGHLFSRAEAAAISSVEGLTMSQDMIARFERFDLKSLSVEERIAEIKKHYAGLANANA